MAEVFGRHKSGEEFPVEISLGPFQLRGRTWVLATIVNISDRKNQEKRLQEQKNGLERSNQDLEAFAYAASHDLQEPLRAVNGFLQLLKKYAGPQLDEKALGYLGNAARGADRMRSLTQGLLEYSRLGRSEDMEVVDTNRVLKLVLDDLKVLLEEVGCSPLIEPLPPILGNRVLLRQIFQNLLGNSIKFRSEKPLEITVKMVERAGESVILVQDNGQGIDPDFKEKAFMLFQRGRAGKGVAGFGLGLAMVAKAVQLMKGTIVCEAALGQGAQFYVKLNFNPDLPKADISEGVKRES
jgi:light-regulated signal transduction histidine kinase (bacteriophytochrome)